MNSETLNTLDSYSKNKYKYGFVTDIDNEKPKKGLNEDTIKFISLKKNEPDWMLEWRLKAFSKWKKMKEPKWANLNFPEIDYQDIYYYSAPKGFEKKPKDLSEVDPKLIETYNKLGIPLEEQKVLAGVAVDVVFDSVSVATTYKGELEKLGIIFCSIGHFTPSGMYTNDPSVNTAEFKAEKEWSPGGITEPKYFFIKSGCF